MDRETEYFYMVIKCWCWEKDKNETEYIPEHHKGDSEFTYFRKLDNAKSYYAKLKENELEKYKAVAEVNPDLNPKIALDKDCIFEWTYCPGENELTTLTIKIMQFEFYDIIETED